jgi:hypothetical protein
MSNLSESKQFNIVSTSSTGFISWYELCTHFWPWKNVTMNVLYYVLTSDHWRMWLWMYDMDYDVLTSDHGRMWLWMYYMDYDAQFMHYKMKIKYRYPNASSEQSGREISHFSIKKQFNTVSTSSTGFTSLYKLCTHFWPWRNVTMNVYGLWCTVHALCNGILMQVQSRKCD